MPGPTVCYRKPEFKSLLGLVLWACPRPVLGPRHLKRFCTVVFEAALFHEGLPLRSLLRVVREFLRKGKRPKRQVLGNSRVCAIEAMALVDEDIGVGCQAHHTATVSRDTSM